MKWHGPLVFGMVDGSVLVLGLFLGEVVAGQSSAALWHAALGGGLAEFGGMSLGQYWAQPEDGKLSAFANGAGCALTCIVGGLPFAFLARGVATIVSAVVIFLVGVLICILREETGKLAVMRTFGLLTAAGVLSGASGLILWQSTLRLSCTGSPAQPAPSWTGWRTGRTWPPCWSWKAR